jgi:putative ABC transport system permease protein
MLVPFWQVPWLNAYIAVHTEQDPALLATSIADAVHSVDPEVAISLPMTMEQGRDEVLANDKFTMILFVSSAVLALLLAGVGMYGVMNFAVSQRSHEIAVRTALGAQKKDVLGLVLKEGIALALIGLALTLDKTMLQDVLSKKW